MAVHVWGVYEEASGYVARAFEILPEGPKLHTVVHGDLGLEKLRDWLHERGLTCFPRREEDDPTLLETWL